ncbi:alkaline phosphatase family protein [archaeon]|nr:alkaline phosphatase family protein [archaeon]
MHKPDYKNSIANLMSSISKAVGVKNNYSPLKQLNINSLKSSKNIVLLVIDGLGYEYLMKHGKNTTLQKYLVGKITTVFPSTTGAAIPTFQTGVPPQQHGMTGWYVFLKELGTIAVMLPALTRFKSWLFQPERINPELIYPSNFFFDKIKIPAYIVLPKEITNSFFQQATCATSRKFPYCTLNEFIKQIKKAVFHSKKRKYIYAYWHLFDYYCHREGTESRTVLNHFKELDKKIMLLINSLKNTNTALIITSDHGFVNVPKNKLLNLNDHPKLNECLVMPFCGDCRVIYCYVKPSKTKQFEQYAKTKLKHVCWLYKSEDLIKKNFFGYENSKIFSNNGRKLLNLLSLPVSTTKN